MPATARPADGGHQPATGRHRAHPQQPYPAEGAGGRGETSEGAGTSRGGTADGAATAGNSLYLLFHSHPSLIFLSPVTFGHHMWVIKIIFLFLTFLGKESDLLIERCPHFRCQNSL